MTRARSKWLLACTIGPIARMHKHPALHQLGKADSIARQQIDNRQAAVEELEAQIKIDEAAVENAKARLSYTSLLAPFDGIRGSAQSTCPV